MSLGCLLLTTVALCQEPTYDVHLFERCRQELVAREERKLYKKEKKKEARIAEEKRRDIKRRSRKDSDIRSYRRDQLSQKNQKELSIKEQRREYNGVVRSRKTQGIQSETE